MDISEPTWLYVYPDGSMCKQPRMQKMKSGKWRILVEHTNGQIEKAIPEIIEAAERVFNNNFPNEPYDGAKIIVYEMFK